MGEGGGQSWMACTLAGQFVSWRWLVRGEERTNAHDNQEAGQEATEVDNGAARALHEVIWVGGAAAGPVWQRGNNVGRNDQQREVVVP